MQPTKIAVAAVAGMLTAGGAWADPVDQPPRDRVGIRTYDTTGIEPGIRLDAAAAAAAILAAAGIDSAWDACGDVKTGAAVSRCAQPLQSDELAVRFVRAGAVRGRTDPRTLGYAYVDTASGTGALATVYADRAAALARRAEVSLSTVLGRAVAHEVGHLLLGTNTHSTSGLMRTGWTPDALQGASVEWLFAPWDAAAIRHGLRGRVARGPLREPADASAARLEAAR